MFITKTKVYKWQVKSIYKNYSEFDDNFRHNNCFKCGYKFKHEDQVHLLTTDGLNKIICDECAAEIEKKLLAEKKAEEEKH